MSITTRQILESKGFTVKDEIAKMVEVRWRGLEEAKEKIDASYLGESKIGLTNIPGGERID